MVIEYNSGFQTLFRNRTLFANAISQLIKQLRAELLWLTWGRKPQPHLPSSFFPCSPPPFPQPLIHDRRALRLQEMQFENHWNIAKYLAVLNSLGLWLQNHSWEEQKTGIYRALTVQVLHLLYLS